MMGPGGTDRAAMADLRRLLRRAGAVVLLISAAACAGGRALRPSPFPTTSASGVESPDPERLTRVLNHALALLGTPYRLGGEEPRTGLDCSGLVRYVFGQSGVALPRTVAEQFDSGQRIDRDELRAGDLIFFDTTDPGPSHVAIAIDAGSFVHAPGSGGVVRVDRLTAPYWRSRLRGVKRISLSRPPAMAP